MIESGLKDFLAASYVGVLAPAKTPPEIVAMLEKALVKALAEKSLQDKFLATGAELVPEPLQTSKGFGDYIKQGVRQHQGRRSDRRSQAGITDFKGGTLMRALIGAVVVVLGLGPAAAQDYPNKPITIVVPAAAGGPTDTISRITAQAMSKLLGQQIVIENVGGAGGTIGTGRVVRAEPDGYTLLIYHVGLSTAATLYRKLPYDTRQGVRPDRADHRRADDHHRAQRFSEPNLCGIRRPSQKPGRQDHAWATPASARRRICAACCSCRKPSCSSPPCRTAAPVR